MGGGSKRDGLEAMRLFLTLIPQLTPLRGSETPEAGRFPRQRGAESWLPKDRDFLQGTREAVHDPGDHMH